MVFLKGKNMSLEELAKTMLNENALPKYFWADAVNIACYVSNRVLIRPILKKTPYELLENILCTSNKISKDIFFPNYLLS